MDGWTLAFVVVGVATVTAAIMHIINRLDK